MKTFTLLLALAVFPRMLLATIIHVPADSATIQSAIDGAIAGDTVVVADGGYNETVDMLGKSILVASWFLLDDDSSHIANTVASGVSFTSGEDSLSVLYGLTIRGSTTSVFADSCKDVELRYCHIENGDVLVWAKDGSWIQCQVLLTDCVLSNADIFCGYHGFAVLKRCAVDGNITVEPPSPGPAECSIDSSQITGDLYRFSGHFTVTNSCIDGNVTSWQASTHISNSTVMGIVTSRDEAGTYIDSSVVESLGGGHYGGTYVFNSLITGESSPVGTTGIRLRNCTVVSKFTLQYTFLDLDSTVLYVDGGRCIECTQNHNTLRVHCTDVFGFDDDPWPGIDSLTIADSSDVFFADPQFCYPAGGDYHISESSPCAPLNNDCNILIGAFDIGCESPYECGDVNISGGVDIDDVVFLVNYVFLGGPAPTPIEMGDTDCSGFVDIDDIVYLIQYIFSGGYAPCDIDGDGIPDC